MADKKISQLPIGSLDSETIFPIVSNGITSKTTFEDVVDALEPYFSGGSGGQDLQTILTEGSTAIINGNRVDLLTDLGLDTRVEFELNSGNFQTLFSLSDSGNIYQSSSQGNNESSFLLGYDTIQLTKISNGFQTQFRFPNNGIFGSATFDLPIKPTGLYVLATIDDIPNVGVKTYKAIISQTGTNAPTANVLVNTLGGTITFSRFGAGIYIATLSGATMPYQLKTAPTISTTLTENSYGTSWSTSSSIEIDSRNSAGVFADGLLFFNVLEIQVYP